MSNIARPVNDFAQVNAAIGGGRQIAYPELGPVVDTRPLAQRVFDLENRSASQEALVTKAIEELCMRLSELERLVRG